LSIAERLIDADVLWASGRRDGALLSVLVAITAAAREAYPNRRDGDAFRTFLAAHHAWFTSVEHRGQQVTVDQLMWKWLRCELAHQAGLPVDIRIDDATEDGNDLWIRAGGAPEFVVRLSAAWYPWLRSTLDGRAEPPA
jgi:hypothetical protein